MTARIIELAQHVQVRQERPIPVRRILSWDVELTAVCLVNGHYRSLHASVTVDAVAVSYGIIIHGRQGAPDQTICLSGHDFETRREREQREEHVLGISEVLLACFGVPA